MTLARAWAVYPDDYRKREVEVLSKWVRAGISGAVIGLPGTGKSNLLGYLASRPKAVAKDAPFPAALVLVDVNSLIDGSLATFYRLILRSLREAHAQIADLDGMLYVTIDGLHHSVEDNN